MMSKIVCGQREVREKRQIEINFFVVKRTLIQITNAGDKQILMMRRQAEAIRQCITGAARANIQNAVFNRHAGVA